MQNFIVKCLVMAMGFFCIVTNSKAQQIKKYPSLFWEISGNGLTKPSYLFGTMHVSSKMVFHLSDSFYHAIRNCDAVALELNPETWQGQMFRMQKAQVNFAKFAAGSPSDYLNEQSFLLNKYEDNLKKALSEEPTAVNSLLYRTYQPQADFEENTYLDLYIYQTGRKMGKVAAGVEDYVETERLMMEAYEDMAKEKIRKTIDTDGESMYTIQRKLQDAYRKGDLDLMDSLDKITATSPAFNEKFLYKRNEIQANSIDTILHTKSLFVGVGAAHLPGERGVIELLRKKGYKLRPIFIQDRDAGQKEQVDKMRVPVNFAPLITDDGMISMKAPGRFFKREDRSINDSWQYADMNNGSYYMLTRLHNHAAMLRQTEKDVLFKIDSMLYENIPGKIIRKTSIIRNGYSGFDILNKTRRGDMQRYHIFVTPFEVMVFKMSGNDNYVEGKEAEIFFSSIQIKERATEGWKKFEPRQGGFAINFPHTPAENLNKKAGDRVDRWEYEARDTKTGNAYMVWKKSVNNYSFLEEDTFDLGLIEESFKKWELLDKPLSRKLGSQNGTRFLEMKFLLKNGETARAKAFVKGSHYFLLAAVSASKNEMHTPFFDSFTFTDFKYSAASHFTDTALNIEVTTAVTPDLDTSLRSWMNKANGDNFLINNEDYFNYWPKNRNALFKSDSTGEAIFMSVETFPKYYYSRDSEKFWNDKLSSKELLNDMFIKHKQPINLVDSAWGYKVALGDTNSSRQVNATLLLKGDRLYRFMSLGDTSNTQSSFIKQFFNSVRPYENKGSSVFKNKLSLFFDDYYSTDSVTKKRANKSISNIHFGAGGIDRLMEAIGKVKFGDKDYFEVKSKLIAELGYIDDSCCVKKVTGFLKEIYEKTADTSYFQNPALTALARLKTKESFSLLKSLLLQDPPVFERTYEYSGMFNQLSDTLALAKSFFPQLLQLASVEDYKEKINDLLCDLVDSGIVKAADYESYFSQLYFDAKIQLKKLKSRDEKLLEKLTKQTDEDAVRRYDYNKESESSPINQYAVLMMPFYDSNPVVPAFFEKILQSKDLNVQLETILLLLRNHKKVPDSLIENVASRDKFRAKLLAGLEKISRAALFPAKYKQEDVARSLLMNDKGVEKFAAIELVSKRYYEESGEKGQLYLFKYKSKKDDDWQMGISGLQPLNNYQVNSNSVMVKMTEKKLLNGKPVQDQFDEQIKRLIYSKHKSSRRFYSSGFSSFMNDGGDDYGD